MIQKYQPVPTLSMDQGRNYKEPTADRLKEAYAWLNTTFTWRPIFDWDYFVTSGMESLEGNLDVAFSGIRQQYKLGNTTKSTNEMLLGEVSKQFQIMRDAGIPIHLLLGRRNPDESSLYWGWPYNSEMWEQSLKAPLDAGLAPVAAHIDTLSVFYDLRNPLGEQRLEEIDKRQPYLRPEAYCPRPNDPWLSTKDSVFKKQWQDRPSRISKRKIQKTANKKTIGKQPHILLASNLDSCPPVGEYADEHSYDDPETNKSIPETLHQVARRAAFEREAVGWHRFWTEYAPQMTNLKELQVRMPRNFDSVGSWSLRQLLNPKKTWVMFSYADERGHMQTRQDLLQYVADHPKLHMHASQEKIWPAGRFVRRNWTLWTPEPTDATIVALHRGISEVECPTTQPSANNKSTGLHKIKSLAGEKREKEELEKAIKQARETARKEKRLEASLPLPSSEDLVEDSPAVIPRSEDIERRLTGTYGRHIRRVAQRTWRTEMRGQIEQLEDATIIQDVLRNTGKLLRKRMQNFRPEEVFTPCDRTERANGLDFVKHATDYATEERKRRGEVVQEHAGRTGKPSPKSPSTNTTPGTLPCGPQQPLTSPVGKSPEKSSSDSTSSDESDPGPTRFTPAMPIKQITATRTVTTQQGSEFVLTSQTTQTTQTQQEASIARQNMLAQQLASNLAAGPHQKNSKSGKKANKKSNEGKRATHKTLEGFGTEFAQHTPNEKAGEEKKKAKEQAAEKRRLVEEKEAAVAKAEAEEKARIVAENKAVEEKKKSDEAKKQNAEIKRQVEEVKAAAAKKVANEKAAREEAEQKAHDVKKQAAAEKKELTKQADAEEKKAKDDVAAARKKAKDDMADEKKRIAAKEAARKEAEQKAADDAAEATEIAAAKAKEAAATIKAVNNEKTPDIVPTIEDTLPGKPTKKPTKKPAKKPTKSSKTLKEESPKTPKGKKRKQPSPDPPDDDAVNESKPAKKPCPSKEASTVSTPARRSARLRTQTPAKTPTPQVEFPSDVSVTEESEYDSEVGGEQKKGKKEPEVGDDYKPPGSTKKRTPTKGARAVRGKAMGSKAATPVKGRGKGRKRAAEEEEEDEGDEEDEEVEEIVKKKPTKKSVKKPARKKAKTDDQVNG
ncbi:hypothetical protein ACET3X_005212 [Alternaria dauci]|uniref:MBD domain-containing protein n=1 Tax=Alternaria dauci TaxID=48095 RepID=A0ABR3UJN6_9PLEO